MKRSKTNGKRKLHGWLKMMPVLHGLRVIILILLGSAPYLLLAQHFDKNKITIQLDKLHSKDQALRERLVYMDQHWHDSLQSDYDSLQARQNAYDQHNMLVVEALNKRYGWQQLMELDDQAKSTIFLVIQHSDSLHQVKFLHLIYQSVKMKALPPNDYALLKDRVTLCKVKRSTMVRSVISINSKIYLFLLQLQEGRQPQIKEGQPWAWIHWPFIWNL